jgi:hypothetical protein
LDERLGRAMASEYEPEVQWVSVVLKLSSEVVTVSETVWVVRSELM